MLEVGSVSVDVSLGFLLKIPNDKRSTSARSTVHIRYWTEIEESSAALQMPNMYSQVLRVSRQ